MIEDPKTGLRIMTKEEFNDALQVEFLRGVMRGRLEHAMDMKSEKTGGLGKNE
tara:strand:- start:277 stop:435 length:159 start_codon:yes stop_codon:yes gene_type:complete